MKTLQIDEKKAKKLYPEASGEWKEILTDTFGEDFFKKKDFRDIKTFNDACEDQNIHPKSVLPYTSPSNADEEGLNTLAMMFVIARALNGDWKADFANGNQYKYYPWFKANASGSGLSCDGCGGWRSASGVGSRLCYKSSEIAEYAGKQFIDIYNKFLI